MVAGILTGSLALISDAAHMLTDTIAIAIALAAIRIGRRSADSRRTFGYQRFEILAAAFNALLLFAVAAYILFEAWQRLRNPAPVASLGMLVVATLGLLVNSPACGFSREARTQALTSRARIWRCGATCWAR